MSVSSHVGRWSVSSNVGRWWCVLYSGMGRGGRQVKVSCTHKNKCAYFVKKKIAPPPNIIPLLCCSFNTFNLFYHREKALTKRKQESWNDFT